uniref:Uncharacterized protein n=1 Tax=Anguilla anguilla TaxID=7936 RepID=A0A0E9R7H8_ANGAN
MGPLNLINNRILNHNSGLEDRKLSARICLTRDHQSARRINK